MGLLAGGRDNCPCSFFPARVTLLWMTHTTSRSATLAPGSDSEATRATKESRDHSIETLRGIAIVLVVAYHAVADLPAGPSVTTELDLYGYAAESLRFVRMPLFTVISGFVYAMRPVTSDRLGSFAVGKCRRVLVPYLVSASLLLFLSWTLGMGELTISGWDLFGHFLVGPQHLWYLPAILVVFGIVALLEARYSLATSRRLAVAVLIAALTSFVAADAGSISGWIPIGGSAYLLPYFLFGLGCRRFGWHQLPAAGMVAATAAALALGAQHLTLNGLLELPLGRHSVLATVGGLATATLLLRLARRQVWLANIGGFSMTIYLFHFYGLSVGKAISEAFSFGSSATLALKLIVGLSIPVALEVVAVRSRPGRIALGHRPSRQFEPVLR